MLFAIGTTVAVYVILVFFVSRLVVPFMGFRQQTMPVEIPPEIKTVIAELESKATNQREYLQAVYDLILDKTLHQWRHTRFGAATHFHRGFVKDLAEIWQTRNFVYCTGINYAAFVLLCGSKYFRPEQIQTRHVVVNFFIHQYLRVQLGDQWVDFDPAGTGIRGHGLGHHLSWFG